MEISASAIVRSLRRYPFTSGASAIRERDDQVDLVGPGDGLVDVGLRRIGGALGVGVVDRQQLAARRLRSPSARRTAPAGPSRSAAGSPPSWRRGSPSSPRRRCRRPSRSTRWAGPRARARPSRRSGPGRSSSGSDDGRAPRGVSSLPPPTTRTRPNQGPVVRSRTRGSFFVSARIITFRRRAR